MNPTHERPLTRTPKSGYSRVEYLETLPCWKGLDTPLFIGPEGKAVSVDWINTALRSTAAAAGLRKRVTTHVVRKSVGTLIANQNPKLAMLQLGITQKIFERHYNQPLLEDRLNRRDLLPEPKWEPRTPEELLATAHADYVAGRLSREAYEAVLEQAHARKRLPQPKTPEPYYIG
ncbi:MAG: hypothetical protein ACT4PT_08940 [Methanobacteriota archaeon]